MASRLYLAKKSTDGPLRKRGVRFKSGKLANGTRRTQELASEPHKTKLILDEAAFRRMALEVVNEIKPDIHWDEAALKALHDFAEIFLVHRFATANGIAMRDRRICIQEQDMKAAALLDSK